MKASASRSSQSKNKTNYKDWYNEKWQSKNKAVHIKTHPTIHESGIWRHQGRWKRKDYLKEYYQKGWKSKTNSRNISESTKKLKKAQAHSWIYSIKTQPILQSTEEVAVHSLTGWDNMQWVGMVKYLISWNYQLWLRRWWKGQELCRCIKMANVIGRGD